MKIISKLLTSDEFGMSWSVKPEISVSSESFSTFPEAVA